MLMLLGFHVLVYISYDIVLQGKKKFSVSSDSPAQKGRRTEVIDTRKTGNTRSEPAGFERTYDRFEERTTIQRFGHALSRGSVAMDFVSNGLESYTKYDHNQDTYEMVNVYTEVQTTYAYYGSNGEW